MGHQNQPMADASLPWVTMKKQGFAPEWATESLRMISRTRSGVQGSTFHDVPRQQSCHGLESDDPPGHVLSLCYLCFLLFHISSPVLRLRFRLNAEEAARGGGGGDGEGEGGSGAGKGGEAGVGPGATCEGVGAPECVSAAGRSGEAEGEVSAAEDGIGDAEGFTMGGVAEGVVEKAGSAPDDHLAARPDRLPSETRGGGSRSSHSRPTVPRRIVTTAVAPIIM